MIFPLADNDRVAVFRRALTGAGGGAALQAPAGKSSPRRPDPTLADNAQPGGGAILKLQLVHQAVDGAQAVAEAAGRGVAVRERLFDIGDSGAVVLRLDLDTVAVLAGKRVELEGAALGMADQIGSQFRGGQGQL